MSSEFERLVGFIQSFDFLHYLSDNPKILLKISCFTLFGFTSIYLGKIWYSYRFFKGMGIKTPNYKFFYGNNLELVKNNNYSDVIREWTKIYGKTYGFYEGHFPVLVTSDLDIIQEVFVKQSTNFSGRKKIFGSRDDNSDEHMLFTASRSRWKKMRNIMNPTFSSAKLRELGPLFVKCADRLNQVLVSEQEINISEYFKKFTMDSIWNCAFGVDVDIQNNPDNEYFKRCEALFEFLAIPNFLNYIANYLHEFQEITLQAIFISSKLFSYFIDFGRIHPLVWFMNHVFELVEIRKKGNVKKKDYLQLLIDTESENKNEKIFDDYTKTYLDKKLTLNEIKLNLALFMLAGYETTSTTLTYTSYILAKYPEEQTKLYETIKSSIQSEDEIDSDSVNKIEYLDMFIKEVLRMYPIASQAVTRRCMKSSRVKDIDIPVGLVIAVDVLSLHFDEELWGPVDPNLFYPLRHEVKRNPLIYMSFGNGPRNCIGMKFALIELKIALCKLLLNFEIFPSNNFVNKLEFIETVVRRPKNGVKVLLKKRN
nr:cytochrome P450 3045C1-1 [Brachionus rubens]